MLGHDVGEHDFKVAEDFWASSTQGGVEGVQVKVPMLSLNANIREVNPTFLVMDIEGGERELLDRIDYHDINKFILETHAWVIGQEETDRLLETIKQAGFVVAQRVERVYLFKREPRKDNS
jgi:hypothetical protein